MRRRRLIQGIAAWAAWPFAARAQQSPKPVIGILSARSPETDATPLNIFQRGLEEYGYVEGRNVAIEYRSANAQYDRLPSLAAGLANSGVALIAVFAGSRALPAAVSATKSIPIVFSMAGDPVKLGFVASLSRPGGNVTGVTLSFTEAAPKRLALIVKLLPAAKTIAVLVNSNMDDDRAIEVEALKDAARTIGRQIVTLDAGTDTELERAFDKLSQIHPDVLLITADPFFFTRARRIVELAANNSIPTLYHRREYVDDGGLLSYGSTADEAYHILGIYAGRILKGEKPADLPIVQPTKFELVLNLRTARTLGLDVPSEVLAIADVVIE